MTYTQLRSEFDRIMIDLRNGYFDNVEDYDIGRFEHDLWFAITDQAEDGTWTLADLDIDLVNRIAQDCLVHPYEQAFQSYFQDSLDELEELGLGIFI